MTYEYRLEQVDPKQSEALQRRIEDQRRREQQEDANESQSLPAQPPAKQN
jgi:hypothetical protein